MKVGIVTINDDNNYGNKLQNYAVQVVLEKKGINSKTIRNTSRIDNVEENRINYNKKIFRIYLRNYKRLFKKNVEARCKKIKIYGI